MGLLPDEELVARYRSQAGSPDSERCLNELFQRHRSRVALWCLRMTGDRDSAADLAQEVFLNAIRHLDSFRAEAKFTTWLYAIARNHCFSKARSRAAAPQQAGDLLPDLADGSQVLRELMQWSLDETETRVMTLHYVEELPLEAVTRLLQLKNGAGAKAYMMSAGRKLARAVEQWRARGQRASL